MSRPTARDAAIVACAGSALVHSWLAAVHIDERLLAASFALAAVALAGAGAALTDPRLRAAPVAAAGLFAALLVAYPLVTLLGDDRVDALGVATKALEAVGLTAAVAARRRTESFGSLDALVGAGLGMLLLSLGHAH